MKIGISFLFLNLLFCSGCTSSVKFIHNDFYDYTGLSTDLVSIQKNFPDIINIESIGETYEGRSIFAVRLSGSASFLNSKPALMAIFTEHGDEHDMTDLAMGIIQYLANNYNKNDRITYLLNRTEVWIVPMMNPDGVEYDLSGSVKFFSWRKNRRPTGGNNFGVDLNRNWSHEGYATITKDLTEDLRDKTSEFYAGEEPFSESETKSIRDFLLSHRNIRIFIDYHSGSGGFFQGIAGCFSSAQQSTSTRHELGIICEEIIDRFSEEISNPEDKKPAFVPITSVQDIVNALKKHAPFYIKPFFPDNIRPAPGKSSDYVYGQLGILAIGVEIFRDRDFFKYLPERKALLTKNQIRGVLFLLDVLANKY